VIHRSEEDEEKPKQKKEGPKLEISLCDLPTPQDSKVIIMIINQKKKKKKKKKK